MAYPQVVSCGIVHEKAAPPEGRQVRISADRQHLEIGVGRLSVGPAGPRKLVGGVPVDGGVDREFESDFEFRNADGQG